MEGNSKYVFAGHPEGAETLAVHGFARGREFSVFFTPSRLYFGEIAFSGVFGVAP